jgi:hypothetical protein
LALQVKQATVVCRTKAGRSVHCCHNLEGLQEHCLQSLFHETRRAGSFSVPWCAAFDCLNQTAGAGAGSLHASGCLLRKITVILT